MPNVICLSLIQSDDGSSLVSLGSRWISEPKSLSLGLQRVTETTPPVPPLMLM